MRQRFGGAKRRRAKWLVGRVCSCVLYPATPGACARRWWLLGSLLFPLTNPYQLPPAFQLVKMPKKPLARRQSQNWKTLKIRSAKGGLKSLPSILIALDWLIVASLRIYGRKLLGKKFLCGWRWSPVWMVCSPFPCTLFFHSRSFCGELSVCRLGIDLTAFIVYAIGKAIKMPHSLSLGVICDCHWRDDRWRLIVMIVKTSIRHMEKRSKNDMTNWRNKPHRWGNKLSLLALRSRSWPRCFIFFFFSFSLLINHRYVCGLCVTLESKRVECWSL